LTVNQSTRPRSSVASARAHRSFDRSALATPMNAAPYTRAMRNSKWLAALALAFIALAAGAATAQVSPETRRIQESEARKADERTLAYLARFKAALAERFGADPRVSMLVVSEVEGEALVHASAGDPDFVIWQEGRWISTDGRQLKPWATPQVAAANAFPVSRIREAALREAMREYRRDPAKSTDFLGEFTVGYEPAVAQVVVKQTSASLTTGKLAVFAFDPSTGKRIDLVLAAAKAAPIIKSDDLRNDIDPALAALRQAVPQTRLASIEIAKTGIRFMLVDRLAYRFDRAFALNLESADDGTAFCADGFMESDITWSRIADLPKNAVASTDLDEEDIPHARYVIDRGLRSCGPIVVEIVFDNYQIPKPRVRFDARGRYVGKSW
jgi:hypothetical protein